MILLYLNSIIKLIIVLNLLLITGVDSFPNKFKHKSSCDQTLTPELVKEINQYSAIAQRVFKEVIKGRFKGSTYELLQDFVDKFGNRIAGSSNLENAIDYMLNMSVNAGLENVHGEKALVPHWVRGNESAFMISPRIQRLGMLGLGSSIGTPPLGITAPAVVFNSFDEMKNNSDKVKGKIVVFNEKYTGYGETVKYRSFSAVTAAPYGAVAVLIRSVTPYSLYTPHTGMQDYNDNITKIPAACITIEDAKMLRRMYLKNETIIINLKMDAKNYKPATSRNTIAELKGLVKPDKVVVISGHLDSWDVGEGAMDDGGGAFISWNALTILKKLDLRAKRTIRTILWTAEEQGYVGAFNYFKEHEKEKDKFNFLMESDMGTFQPYGFGFSGNEFALCIFQEILKLLEPIGVANVSQPQTGGPDISIWTNQGVPGASISTENERYFWYHHSAADTLDVEDPKSLDYCTAAWAVVSYVVADLSIDMPR